MAYTSFLMSKTGIVKLLETIFGIVTLALVAHYGIHIHYYDDLKPGTTFLLAVVSAGLIVSFIQLVTYFYDDDTRYAVRRSLFELFFTLVMTALVIAAAVTLAYFVGTKGYQYHKSTHELFDPYPGLIAATIFAFILAPLYLLDFLLAYSEMKSTVTGGPRYHETVVYR